METLKAIYYFLFGLVYLMHEYNWFKHTRYELTNLAHYNILQISQKGLKFKEYTHDHKRLFLSFGMKSLFILSWSLIGLLFTFNWFIFLLFIASNVLIDKYLEKRVKDSDYDLFVLLHKWKSFASIFFPIVLILNTYYWKVDVYMKLISIFIK